MRKVMRYNPDVQSTKLNSPSTVPAKPIRNGYVLPTLTKNVIVKASIMMNCRKYSEMEKNTEWRWSSAKSVTIRSKRIIMDCAMFVLFTNEAVEEWSDIFLKVMSALKCPTENFLV